MLSVGAVIVVLYIPLSLSIILLDGRWNNNLDVDGTMIGDVVIGDVGLLKDFKRLDDGAMFDVVGIMYGLHLVVNVDILVDGSGTVIVVVGIM